MWPIPFGELNYTYRIDIVNAYADAIIDGRFIPSTEPVEAAGAAPGFGVYIAFLGLSTIAVIPLVRRKFKN